MTEFPAEPMFDCDPGESPPFGGRENKRIPSVAVTKPPAEIAIKELEAALANNDYFSCLGYRNEVYYFKPKQLDQRTMVTETFSTQWILALAPRDFWLEWSGTEEGKSFPRIMIMDALIRLSQRTGRFVYPYERCLAAESAAR